MPRDKYYPSFDTSSTSIYLNRPITRRARDTGSRVRNTTPDAGTAGQATSFDAELAGLVAALHESIKTARARNSIQSIHLFADNSAALDSLFRPTFHSSQIISVLAARKAREWLQEDASHHIHLHWVPGHKGVELNERVDAMTNEAYELHPPIPHISYAMPVSSLPNGS